MVDKSNAEDITTAVEAAVQTPTHEHTPPPPKDRRIKLIGGSLEDFEDIAGYPLDRIRVWVQYVTPEWAAERLRESGTINRRERGRRIDGISRNTAVRRGFKFTGVPGLFDNKWDIIDSHHRLKAIVKSGKGAYMMVVWGLDKKDVIPVLDDVAVRTLGDRLRMEFGVDNANALAAMSVIFDQLRRPKDKTSWFAPTYQEIVPIFKKYRADMQWAHQAIGPRMEPNLSSGGSPILAAFAFCRPINPVRMDELAAAYHAGRENEPQMFRMRRWVAMVSTGGQHVPTKQPGTRQRHQRWTMTLVALGYIERALLDRKLKSIPKPETDVVDRLIRMRAGKP